MSTVISVMLSHRAGCASLMRVTIAISWIGVRAVPYIGMPVKENMSPDLYIQNVRCRWA